MSYQGVRDIMHLEERLRTKARVLAGIATTCLALAAVDFAAGEGVFGFAMFFFGFGLAIGAVVVCPADS